MSCTFLDELDNSSKKQKFQKYTVKIGIEAFEVIVPFDNSAMFENKLNEEINQTSVKFKSSSLSKIVAEFNGKVKAK